MRRHPCALDADRTSGRRCRSASAREWRAMSSVGTTEADVIVVGAGPTGLMLAGDLATAGVRTTIVERRAEGSNLTRAFGVHARSLEHLDARGLADELVATGSPVRQLQLFDRVHL